MTDIDRILSQDPLPENPLPLIADWLASALAAHDQPNPNSMVLVTVGRDARPSCRTVLCKHFEQDPGYLVFYTNYESRKGDELARRPWAAAHFHWDHSGRQVRLEGPVVRSPVAESDAYFCRAAVAQPDRRMGERAEPADRLARGAGLAGPRNGRTIRSARSGRRERARCNEFDRASAALGRLSSVARQRGAVAGTAKARLHDRCVWVRHLTPTDAGFDTGPWTHERLQP